MSGFHGKAYWYKGKIIGVCPTLSDEMFMIGHVKSSGSYQRCRIKEFNLYSSFEDAQRCLDEFAVSRGLSEVKSW